MVEEKKSRINPLTILLILLRHWWLIVSAVLVCVVAVMLWSYTLPKVYSASTTVRVEQNQSRLENISSLFSYEPNFLTTEIEMIRSRRLAEKVVHLLKMDHYIVESNPIDLANKLEYVTLDFTVIPGDYTIVFDDDKGHYSIIQNGNIIARGKSGYRTEAHGFSLLISNPKSNPSDQVKLHFNNYRGMVAFIQGSMSVDDIKNVNMIRISVNWSDPEMAAQIANTIAKAYVQSSLEDKKTQSSSTRKFIQQQLNRIEDNLQEAETGLQEYQKREKVTNIDYQGRGLIDMVGKLESEIMDSQIMENALDVQKQRVGEMIQNDDRQSLPTMPQVTEDPTLSVFYRNLYDLKLRRIDLRSNYTEENPRIKALDKEIEAVQKQIDEKINLILIHGSFAEKLAVNKDKIRILKSVRDELDARISKLPERQLELARLTRKAKANENIYTLLLNRLQEARINEAVKTAEIQVVDEALVPLAPISPRHAQNLMYGIMVGLALGLLVTFLLEYLDNSIKTPDEMQSFLDLPILGTIGKFTEIISGESGYNRRCLLSHFNPKSPFAEAYRIIRTNLMLSNVDRPPKAFILTSAMVGEGKTTTSVNLSTVMAQTGEKVILVDTDLRRSHLHHVFNVSREPGVTNYLARNATIEEIIHPTIADNLYFVPSGYIPPNPSELLSSQRMEEMIEALKEHSDIVIFDAPPVISVTDAVILGKKLDGVVMVVHATATDRMVALRALQQLRDVGVFVMGGILNGFSSNRSYSKYGYYYYRYSNEGYY